MQVLAASKIAGFFPIQVDHNVTGLALTCPLYSNPARPMLWWTLLLEPCMAMNLVPLGSALQPAISTAGNDDAVDALSATLRKLQIELEAWKEAASGFLAQHNALVDAYQTAVIQSEIDFIHAVESRLDHLATDVFDRFMASQCIVKIVWAMIPLPSAESMRQSLIEIFDRHSPVGFDELRWRQLRAKARQLGLPEGELDGMTFEQAELHLFEFIERMLADAQRQFQDRQHWESQHQAHRASSRARRRPTALNNKEGTRLKRLYQALVRWIHPDRERDPAKRAEKTALMQRVTAAYRAADLLALMDLQVEVGLVARAESQSVREDFRAELLANVKRQIKVARTAIQNVKAIIEDSVHPDCELPKRLTLRSLDGILGRMRSKMDAGKAGLALINRAVDDMDVEEILQELDERALEEV